MGLLFGLIVLIIESRRLFFSFFLIKKKIVLKLYSWAFSAQANFGFSKDLIFA